MQSEKGTPEDKLRAALVYLLTCESLPSDSEYENVSKTLQVRLTRLSMLAGAEYAAISCAPYYSVIVAQVHCFACRGVSVR